MRDYIIITDSTADLSQKQVEEYKVGVIPLEFVIDGKSYFNYADSKEVSEKDFYSKVRNGSKVSTSQVNSARFKEYFEDVLKHDKDILYIAFSSPLSGTYSCAVTAAEELKSKYPGSNIEVVDSLSASMGEGLLVYYSVIKKREGLSLQENKEFLLKNRLNLCHWFIVDDLNHLKRGGRVSVATALLGTMMGIKPILCVDNEGKLVSKGKVRGRRQAIEALLKHMTESAVDPANQTVFISHADCEEDAKFLAELVKSKFKVKDIVINFIGPVIGAHAGSGALALFFTGKNR